ncbi:MAG: aspartate-semialdehyde dehydrogenase [Steroidobacteraceae bacterium]
MSRQWNVAVLGATGLVGDTMIKILEERKFPVGELYPLASNRSLGKSVEFNGKTYPVIDVDTFDFSKADIGLFSAGGDVSRIYAPKAAAAGCVVIDNTSEFRYDDDIPLVVPEVNPQALEQFKKRRIIANPNCSTIQMLVALKPIHDAVGIERINVATYQSVSGAGKEAVEELAEQTVALVSGKGPVKPKVVAAQIAFNVVPQIDKFQDNGYTKEEMKMVWETQKIFGDPSIKVNATTVRVPVFFGHSEVVNVETRKKISVPEVRKLLDKAPGVKVIDTREPGGYPTPAVQAANDDRVFVGRIREDISHERGINLWVVSDNIRKGAATNSVQIAEILIRDHL